MHLGDGSEASPDGDEEPARPAIHAVEQCLTWGGEQRIRLHLTLAVGQAGEHNTGCNYPRSGDCGASCCSCCNAH